MASDRPKMTYPRLSCPYRNCSTFRGMSSLPSFGQRTFVERCGKPKQQLEITLQGRGGKGVVPLFSQHQAGTARTGKTTEKPAEEWDSPRQGPQAPEPGKLPDRFDLLRKVLQGLCGID